MGITDGSMVCGLCGEWRTGCALCGNAPLIDCSAEIARTQREASEAETELWRQEQSIKRAANPGL